MYRRDFLKGTAVSLAALTLPVPSLLGRRNEGRGDDSIDVAFVISDGANVIDLAGAWEVFQDVMIDEDGEHRHPFRLYTVSDRAGKIEATGGLTLVPDHTLEDAPSPDIVSVGAQRGSPAIHRWLSEQAGRADILMSVCTGAFQLGRAGVLSGKRATTHHLYWDSFAEAFPDVTLVRGRRFVEDGDIVTAGGLTSGIDAALHVVARTVGEAAAERTAEYMEYDSDGWRTGERTPTGTGGGADLSGREAQTKGRG